MPETNDQHDQVMAMDRSQLALFLLRQHLQSPYCWCVPELTYVDEETGGMVWRHKGPEEVHQ